MFVTAAALTTVVFDIALVATTLAGLASNAAVTDSNNCKANNIDQKASQQSLQHMRSGTTRNSQ